VRSLLSQEHISQIADALKRQRVEVRKPVEPVAEMDELKC